MMCKSLAEQIFENWTKEAERISKMRYEKFVDEFKYKNSREPVATDFIKHGVKLGIPKELQDEINFWWYLSQSEAP